MAAVPARCADDFRLALMLSIGVALVLMASGIAVHRFSAGDAPAGLLNLSLALALGGVLVRVALRVHTQAVAALFVVVVALATIANLQVMGRSGLFGVFLVLWLSFVLVRPRLAVWVDASLLLTVLLGYRALFDSGTEWVTYLVTGGLVSWAAWQVATRLDGPHPAPQVQSDDDPLTGASSRDSLPHALERYQLTGGRGMMAIVDIDWFKQVNDEHGHAAGDRVLVGLVELLGQRLRRIDGIYRLGGEEFVLLLPDLRLEDAAPRLYALQAELNAGLSRLPGRATVSMGAATNVPDEGWQDWLARAEAALNLAKQSGRNRVVIDAGPRTQRDMRRELSRL